MIKKLLPILLLCIFSKSYSQTHEYRFVGNTLNAFGAGPALSDVFDATCGGSAGGFTTESIVTSACTSGSPQTVYAYPLNDGLSYPNATGLGITGTYTLSVLYRVNDYTQGAFTFQKLIDFNNGTNDDGIYSYNNGGSPTLAIVTGPPGSPSFSLLEIPPALDPTKYFFITVVRDGGTNLMDIYVNGTSATPSHIIDAAPYFVSNGTNPIIFFRDDVNHSAGFFPCEAGAGEARYISLSNAPSDATQVQTAWLALCNGVLPVTLTDFGAQKNNTNVALQWQTSNQLNTAYFDVERSYDGQTFTAIGRVNAKTTSNSYSYNDIAAISLSISNAYYRLKITDINGKYTYSSKVKVSYGIDTRISVFPNPATDVITISGLNNKDVVRLLTVDGKILSQQTANVQSMIVNIGKYQPGTYIIQVKNDKEVTQQKFVKY